MQDIGKLMINDLAGTRPAETPKQATQQNQKKPVHTTSSARCCVNGAFYTCSSGLKATQCVGEPMRLMQCVQSCGMMDSSCEPKCIQSHGPNPGVCTRDSGRDREC